MADAEVPEQYPGFRSISGIRVSIVGLDKAEVLAALYNRSKTQGAGWKQFDASKMSVEEARSILKQQTDFEYLKGRVMKINFARDDYIETRLYDRDNGPQAAEITIESLRMNK